MSFQINCNRLLISICLLLNIVVLLISNTHASSIKYSQPVNGDDGNFIPMMHKTHDIRRTNTRTEPPNTFDDGGQQRSFSIRLRDLQNFIGHLVDNEQMKIENDAIATVGQIPNRRALSTNLLFNEQIVERVRRFAERYIFQDAAANAMQTSGRVFLFKGLHSIIFVLYRKEFIHFVVIFAPFQHH